MEKRVLLPIAQGTEDMEAVITIDILRRAGISVKVAGENEIISCARGVRIIPDILIDQIDEEEIFDAVILPGGKEGTRNILNNSKIESILLNHKSNNKIIAAICAAPAILVEQKLIPENSIITSHPSASDIFLNYKYTEKDVVRDGNFITSRGAGTAIDFALFIVEVLLNSEIKEKIIKDIVYLKVKS